MSPVEVFFINSEGIIISAGLFGSNGKAAKAQRSPSDKEVSESF